VVEVVLVVVEGVLVVVEVVLVVVEVVPVVEVVVLEEVEVKLVVPGKDFTPCVYA
jgi:hypothetical protein